MKITKSRIELMSKKLASAFSGSGSDYQNIFGGSDTGFYSGRYSKGNHIPGKPTAGNPGIRDMFNRNPNNPALYKPDSDGWYFDKNVGDWVNVNSDNASVNNRVRSNTGVGNYNPRGNPTGVSNLSGFPKLAPGKNSVGMLDFLPFGRAFSNSRNYLSGRMSPEQFANNTAFSDFLPFGRLIRRGGPEFNSQLDRARYLNSQNQSSAIRPYGGIFMTKQSSLLTD